MADPRRLAAAALTLALGALALVAVTAPAAAQTQAPTQTRGRVAVVFLDGTSIEDWHRYGGPALRALLSEGAVGLVHTGVARGSRDRAAAEAGANADPHHPLRVGGVQPAPERDGVRALRPGAVRAGLGDVATAGVRSAVIVASPGTEDGGTIHGLFGRDASRALDATFPLYEVEDPTYPGGVRTDTVRLATDVAAATAEHDLTAIDPSDTFRLDATIVGAPERERWVARALIDADRVIATARRGVGADGTLAVLAIQGPRRREAPDVPYRGRFTWPGDPRGQHLGAAAIAGPRYPAGLLTSRTTRIAGLVSLIDVAPTLITAGGFDMPPGLRGAVMEVERGAGAAVRARQLDRDLTTTARAHRPTLGVLFGALLLGALIAAVLFAERRGRAPRGRIPYRARDLALTIFTAALLAPAALLVVSDWRALAASTIGALVLRLVVGARWCVTVAALASIAPAVAARVAPAVAAAGGVGHPRAETLPAGGEPAAFGLAVAAALLLLGALEDRIARRRLWLRIGAPAIAAGGLLVATDDPRAAGVLAAAALWFAVRSAGVRLRYAAIGAAALGTLAAAAWLLGGPEPVVTVREARTFLTDHARNLGPESLAVLAGAPLLALWLARRDETGRAAFGRPGIRAAIGAAVVAALAICVAYPGGLHAAGWTLIPAVAGAGAIVTGARNRIRARR